MKIIFILLLIFCFRCLIFGTDGLWNVVTPQEAVDIVYKKESINERLQAQKHTDAEQENTQWTNPSKGLVEQALRTWSAKKMRADNTSVVTVILYPPQNSAHKSAPPTEENPMTEFSISLNDNSSFQEIAEKYLAPEKFRNINYFAVDAEEEREEEDDYINMYYEPTDWHKFCNGEISWQEKFNDKSINSLTATEDDDDGDDDEEDDDDDDDDEENDESSISKYFIETTCLIESKYPNMYMNNNSFAESYNALLNAHITREENTTAATPTTSASAAAAAAAAITSAVNCENNAQLGMQQILQEQQMYQQQCMSGEDGYMLTKLETRREQQRLGCSAVQTYKICNQMENSNYQEALHELPTQSHNASMPGYWERLPTIFAQQQQQQQQQQLQQQQTKLIELNALLQQERDEEQQVAFELEQQQQQQQQQLRWKLQRLQSNETAVVAAVVNAMPICEQINTNVMPSNDGNTNTYLVGETLITPMEIDETVQINEISSSSSSSSNSSCSSNSTSNLEKRDKIEIIHEKAEYKTKSEILLSKAIKSPYYVPTAPPTTRRVMRKIRQQFANIPNENKRELNHRALLIKSNVSNNSCSVAVKNRRQLRSNNKNNITPISSNNNIDFYSKRTLRTRNSLTKDMKAKSSLKRSNCSNVVSQLLNKTCNMCNNELSKAQLSPHVINLRSRQINSNMPTKPQTKTVAGGGGGGGGATTAATISATAELSKTTVCVTRSLRSSRANNLAVAVSTDNYSKPTRLQSMSSTLAPPPPSPKLFQSNSSTRSRTLLNKSNNNNNHNNNSNINNCNAQLRSARTTAAPPLPPLSSTVYRKQHGKLRNVPVTSCNSSRGSGSSLNVNNNKNNSNNNMTSLQSARNGRVQKRLRR